MVAAACDDERLARIRAREALILGKPQRLAPLPPEACASAAHEISLALMRALGRPEPEAAAQRPRSVQISTLLRHGDLYQAHAALGLQLLTAGALAARDRELVILRTVWLCEAPLAWGEHVDIGKRAGLASDDIERVTQGSAAEGWSRRDAALQKSVEELHQEAMVSDPTWDQLQAVLNDAQLIEVLILAGHYRTVAYYQNAIRFSLKPGNHGLAAR